MEFPLIYATFAKEISEAEPIRSRLLAYRDNTKLTKAELMATELKIPTIKLSQASAMEACFNIAERSKVYANSDEIREKVEKWYLENKGRYDEFKKQADGVGKMDFTFFMNLMKFSTDCIPKDKLDVCGYVFRLACGDIPFRQRNSRFHQAT